MIKRKNTFKIFLLLIILVLVLGGSYFGVRYFHLSINKDNSLQNESDLNISNDHSNSSNEEKNTEIENSDPNIENETVNNEETNNQENELNISENNQSSNNNQVKPSSTPTVKPTTTPTSQPSQNNNSNQNNNQNSQSPVPSPTPTPNVKTDLEMAIEYQLQAGDDVTYRNGKPITVNECMELGNSLLNNQTTSQVYQFECPFTEYGEATAVGLKVYFFYNGGQQGAFYDDYLKIINNS